MMLTKPYIVTYAVGMLGGELAPVDREDVAIFVADIAPDLFSWRKYPERVDLEAVSVALRDARKARYGSLLVGDSSHGWMLSSQGALWFRNFPADNLGAVASRYRRGSITEKLEEERCRLQSTKAYLLYVEGRMADISMQDFYEFARINEYFDKHALNRRYSVIANATVGIAVLEGVWAYLKERFLTGGQSAEVR